MWGSAPKTTLKKVEVAQRALLKVVTFRPYCFPSFQLYNHWKVLTVRPSALF